MIDGIMPGKVHLGEREGWEGRGGEGGAEGVLLNDELSPRGWEYDGDGMGWDAWDDASHAGDG